MGNICVTGRWNIQIGNTKKMGGGKFSLDRRNDML